jgi:hypothetical protein
MTPSAPRSGCPLTFGTPLRWRSSNGAGGTATGYDHRELAGNSPRVATARSCWLVDAGSI